MTSGGDGLKSPIDWGGPGYAPDRQIWLGKSVTCDVCLQANCPVMTDDGWRLPVHHWWSSTHCAGVCPGSLSSVTAAPVAATMTERIERHVVAAMPEPHSSRNPEHQEEIER